MIHPIRSTPVRVPCLAALFFLFLPAWTPTNAATPANIPSLKSGPSHAEEVELTGTFQIQIACADTHHEEVAMVMTPGNERFSGEMHALNIDNETRKRFKIGERITVKGTKQKFSTKKMTKGQIRKAMVEFIKHGKGLPLECAELGEIISKIKVENPAQFAAGAHNHGEVKLKPVADDNEIVEVGIMEHIEVTSIEATK